MEEEIIKKEELQNELKFKQINNNNKIDLYPYQCLLFLFTQFGYLAVVPSMLLTTFFEPNLEFCQHGKDENFQNSAEERLFHSLLIEWKEHCKNSIWTVLISSIVLLGTIIGSFVAGFVADLSMFSICFFNFLLFLFGGFNKIFALFILFFIGTACGGYMVTNMVLLVEVLRNPTARLLVVSLNGWPFGMIGTAFLAFFLPNWKLYSLAISIFALLFSVIIQYFACESIPWLIQSGKQQKAHFAQQHLIRINSFLALTKKEEINEAYDLFMPNNENTNFENSIEGINEAIKEEEREDLSVVVYTYFDLFRFSSIRIHLLSLLFCFGSSSIVSFGLYFSAELLPGSRYLNIALMGFCKLTFGFIPFIASNFMGRKPILLISIGFAMFSAWSLVICHLFNFDKYFVITVFGLLMTGAIDPNWKIIHLLSIELFPTPIRNMARALCNAFSRLGSLLGPWFLLTKVGNNQFFPFFVFSILLTIQFFICLIFLPETKGKPLPNSLIKYSSNKNNLNIN